MRPNRYWIGPSVSPGICQVSIMLFSSCDLFLLCFIILSLTLYHMPLSRIRLLTSKISHICQEICDIKSRRKPQTNIAIQNYTNTGLVEGQTNRNYTRAPDNNNSAKEGSDDEDGLGETYSSHSKLCHRAPNNVDIPSRHAPSLPSPNPPPTESILEPPGDLSPSPASRIATLSPSSLS